MPKNDLSGVTAPASGRWSFSSRDPATERFIDAKLPTTFRVHIADGKSFSVVRRDVLDGALARYPKK
jgi:hypothetical protein